MASVDTKFLAIKDIFSLLSNDPIIQSYVGRKIFPIVARQSVSGDFIAIQRDGYRVSYTKMGMAMQRSIFFITVVSEDYDRSLEIAERVFQVLHGDHTNPDLRIRLEDYGEDFLDKKYVQVLKFNIE